MDDKKVLKVDTGVVNRTFSYKLDDVTLSFTLRIDVKKELKAFAEIMQTAIKDVDEQIKKI